MRHPIAIIADFQATSKSHLATNEALTHSALALDLTVEACWINTGELAQPAGLERLREFDGLWIGPGSPYASTNGVLAAIRMAREARIPLLGTCGGFQHIVLEYGRNVMGLSDAQHEEGSPGASRLLISRLACSLAGRTMTITLDPSSILAGIMGSTAVQEEYLCNYGVNPEYEEVLRSARDLRVVASYEEGAVRAVELTGHPFFIGTLFLPQHRSLPGSPHPLVTAFMRTCAPQGTLPTFHNAF
jgi:CTP synthase (UTP-ammonia lyase)